MNEWLGNCYSANHFQSSDKLLEQTHSLVRGSTGNKQEQTTSRPRQHDRRPWDLQYESIVANENPLQRLFDFPLPFDEKPSLSGKLTIDNK